MATPSMIASRVTGTVLQYRFANPHVYLTLQVKNADGSTTRLEIEAGAASVLNGLRFTKDSGAAGDVVTVVGNPDRKNPGFVLGKESRSQSSVNDTYISRPSR